MGCYVILIVKMSTGKHFPQKYQQIFSRHHGVNSHMTCTLINNAARTPNVTSCRLVLRKVLLNIPHKSAYTLFLAGDLLQGKNHHRHVILKPALRYAVCCLMKNKI
jgi:hypothetical protein